ncbi:hypothetical protein TrLO_g8877 [Triparma laevis f. longispina]|uniref:Right handed beta helix domain-containing protein n=1 Tax=Triparma laevis f. longispina TaxID=1714387 RepID=A0A9W7CE78_9STRA|nr:hypothetical protein TrLO_g8877 [Triparma laevis f. longispina]
MSASTSNPLTVVEMTKSFGDVEEGGKSKDSEDAQSLAQSQAEAVAEKGFKAQGSSGIDAFKADRVNAMFQGAGSQLEMITIALTYIQNFGLVLVLDVTWPAEFKAIFGWMGSFAFQVDLPVDMTWVGIVVGLMVAPILIVHFNMRKYPRQEEVNTKEALTNEANEITNYQQVVTEYPKKLQTELERIFAEGEAGTTGVEVFAPVVQILTLTVRHSRPKASADVVALFTAESTTVSTSSYTIDTSELDSRLVKTVASWSENVEMVYTGQGSPWSESRCAVSSVDAAESTLTVNMKTPCFDTLQNKPCGQSTSTPITIENTGLADLLSSDDENSFWVDAENSRVYIKTSTSQSPFAIIPDLETLVSGSNVRSVTFKNLSFEHATYNQATAPAGFIEQQSGALVYTPVTNSSSCDDTTWLPMPSNVRFTDSSSVKFSGCEFRALGTGALQFDGGARNNEVTDSLFEDISGTAIQLGEYNTANITDESLQVTSNKIANNVIRNVANEYHGTCGVQVGYSAFTEISHNEIYDLPYSGVSIGWGWGRSDPSYASNNVINNNKIHDFKLLLGDGGGIYALSAQPNSTVDGNWLYNMGAGAGGGAYYPDQSSAYWTISNNVFSNASFCSDDCEWLHVWQDSIHDIDIVNSYVDTTTYENNGIDVTMENTVVVEEGQDWPQEAKDIMDNAGVRQ